MLPDALCWGPCVRRQVLYEREGALFDALWELLFRTMLPYAGEAARCG